MRARWLWLALAAAAMPAAAQRGVSLAANTPVAIAIEAPLGSKASRTGDAFPISLAEDLRGADGSVLLPRGLRGEGEVVLAATSGRGGRTGQLVLSARYLTCGDVRVPLWRFRLTAAGGGGPDVAGAAKVAGSGAGLFVPGVGIATGVASMFLKGRNVEVPAGARGSAILANEVMVLPGCGASRPRN